MKTRQQRSLAMVRIIACLTLFLLIHFYALAATQFEISYPAELDAGPITGRVFVIISKNNRVEPRLQAGSYNASVPFYGLDVKELKPGENAVLDAGVLGYPVESLSQLPAGDYFVQALLNVYTQVQRKDGHTIWVHMDQWEGQQWNRSPGNLVSEVQQIHLDPAAGFRGVGAGLFVDGRTARAGTFPGIPATAGLTDRATGLHGRG